VSAAVEELAPTAVEGGTIAFRLADAAHALPGVRLWCDLDLGDSLDLAAVPGGWELRLALPDLDCLEYLFEIATDGDAELRVDPGNPTTVDGAFGDHSWLALPGYALPAWLDLPAVPGVRRPVKVPGTPVGTFEVETWSPADASPGERLPLLLAHDGPEMDAFAGLTHYVGALVGAGRLPRMRVALLSPGARNRNYSANPAYATALVRHVLPRLLEVLPTVHRPVLTGQSLGAVAALHAAWTAPGTFGGLLLQSGSFFTPELDAQESDFECWPAVIGFVRSVHAATTAAPGAPPMVITCGSAEENLANNRLMAAELAATGVDVTWGEVRQGHTWTCWRDLLDPHLDTLVRKVWGTQP
jgi:enterochelin esterase family protein